MFCNREKKSVARICRGMTFGIKIPLNENGKIFNFNDYPDRTLRVLQSVPYTKLSVREVKYEENIVSFIIDSDKEDNIGPYKAFLDYGPPARVFREVIFELVEDSSEQYIPEGTEYEYDVPVIEISGSVIFGFDGKDGHSPYADHQTGTWWEFDDQEQEYKDTGIPLNDPDLSQQVAENTEDIEGIRKQIQEESHFRGYLLTKAELDALEATPNDYAYLSEIVPPATTANKWIYNGTAWIDSGTPVPDKVVPKSATTPLMDGEAVAGSEENYAAGDHRHPTDTTRAAKEGLDALSERVGNIDEVLDIINRTII